MKALSVLNNVMDNWTKFSHAKHYCHYNDFSSDSSLALCKKRLENCGRAPTQPQKYRRQVWRIPCERNICGQKVGRLPLFWVRGSSEKQSELEETYVREHFNICIPNDSHGLLQPRKSPRKDIFWFANRNSESGKTFSWLNLKKSELEENRIAR